MTTEICREYAESDYLCCEALVNEAWGFDRNFTPHRLAGVAKCMYTQGSVLHSNHRTIIEVDGEVVGFLFGFNQCRKKPRGVLLFGLRMLWRLLMVRGEHAARRDQLLYALKAHQAARSKVVAPNRSEIVLFVVDRSHQSRGAGKRLWAGFLQDCQAQGVQSIVVETNKLGASGFYERIGFRHLADFDSPLHALATPGGQACMYEFVCR